MNTEELRTIFNDLRDLKYLRDRTDKSGIGLSIGSLRGMTSVLINYSTLNDETNDKVLKQTILDFLDERIELLKSRAEKF